MHEYIDGMSPEESAATVPCVRSGACCKAATCVMGQANGAPPKGCIFLVGDKPGEYACQLIIENPQWGETVAIGGGCCRPMFNPARQQAGAPKSRLELLFNQIGSKHSKS